MNEADPPELASTQRRSRRYSWRLLALCLAIIGCALGSNQKFFEPPVLPPPASGQEAMFTNPAGFAMAFPRGWTAGNHPVPGCCKALTTATPPDRSLERPIMRVEVAYPPSSDRSVREFRPKIIKFQERDATLRAGRISTGPSFWQNLQRAWNNRSIKGWNQGRTHASWVVDFDQDGERITLRYSAPCGRYARIDGGSIPPVLMSYFETFESQTAQ